MCIRRTRIDITRRGTWIIDVVPMHRAPTVFAMTLTESDRQIVLHIAGFSDERIAYDFQPLVGMAFAIPVGGLPRMPLKGFFDVPVFLVYAKIEWVYGWT